MEHGLSVLLANTDAMRAGRDEEYVHQGRVALRRMRSALRLLDRRHEDFPQSLTDDLRWVGRLLGRARDDDVFADQTLPRLMASAPPQHRERIASVIERARARRDETLAVVTESLQTPRYARLALRLQAWVLTTAPVGSTLGELAPKALDKAHKRLFRSAQFFAALPTERRHRVRILAKRLRYALDVFSVALPKKAIERYIDALSELQDVLGELNDGAVAQDPLREIADDPSLVEYATNWLSTRERELAIAAEVRLLALSEIAAPWGK
jgi:CHAD domain-containing protein